MGGTVARWVPEGWAVVFVLFRAVLAVADLRFLLLVPLAMAGEQLVRAWKWRQLLSPEAS